MTERASLSGLTIALTEQRELDRLAEMIEQLGGTAYRCPFITIVDVDDPAPVVGWLRRLADGGLDDLVLLTGEGLSRLVRVAAGAELEARVLAALAAVRTVCRGPKPVRALRAIGLRASLVSETPTTDGVIATLAKQSLIGRRVGVQLYGDEPNDKLVEFLLGAGAEVHTVSPYTYKSGPDGPLLELIAAMAEGRITAIAFTSSPQVIRLLEVAETHQRQEQLRQGLERTRVAAVGPLVAATLANHGLRVDIVPERAFFLRPMVTEIAAFFSGAAQAGKPGGGVAA